MSSKLESLRKNDKYGLDGGKFIDIEEQFESSTQQMRLICDSLIINSKEYKPIDTLDLLENYFTNEKYLDRLLYSEFSALIFKLDDDQAVGNLASNITCLMNDSTKSCYHEKVKNAVTKIYDHCTLAIRQREQFALYKYAELEVIQQHLTENQNSLSNDLSKFRKEQEQYKESFDTTIKNTLRDYITIFGVFSAIIIAFVGGISYSASVLESINKSSIYRLIFSICLLGLVLFNVIYILLYVIMKISKIEINKSINLLGAELPIHQFVNVVFIIIMFFDLLFYFIRAEDIRNYIDWLPW